MAQERAYEIGLRPWEFWKMTRAEFRDAVAGYERRQEREYERAAWMLHHMYAMHITRKGAKPPSIDKLLNRKSKPRE